MAVHRRLIILLSLAWWGTQGTLGAQDAFHFHGDNLTSTLTQGREKTILRGNAQIETGDLVIGADEIELSGTNLRYAVCRGAVSVKDDKKSLTLHADKMEYDREKKISQLSGNTSMEDGKNALIVRAGFLEYRETDEQVEIQVTVRIFKKNLTCRSESAFYDRKGEFLKLSGLPQVFKNKDEYKAGHISVNLKTDEITLDDTVSGTIIPAKKKKETEKKADPAVPDKPAAETNGPPPGEAPQGSKGTPAP